MEVKIMFCYKKIDFNPFRIFGKMSVSSEPSRGAGGLVNHRAT